MTTLHQAYVKLRVKCVPCHHGMARPQVADRGEGLQVWRAAASILNKKSRTVDNGIVHQFGDLVGAANNSPP
jgi:hypothetical protein